MTSPQEKLKKLEDILASFERTVTAYSGGADSTFLAWMSQRVLGERTWGVFIDTPLLPPSKREEALQIAHTLGLSVRVLPVNIWDERGILENGPRRCYFCKRLLFLRLKEHAGGATLCEGTNADEAGEYRPGLQAKEELGVRSPLLEAGLTKEDIRALSREFGLPTWNKPPYSCLATRIPQGVCLTPALLERLGSLEHFLEQLGFSGFRIRHHDAIARLEFEEHDFSRILDPKLRQKILAEFKRTGYDFVVLDLAGYQKGSMDCQR